MNTMTRLTNNAIVRAELCPGLHQLMRQFLHCLEYRVVSFRRAGAAFQMARQAET